MSAGRHPLGAEKARREAAKRQARVLAELERQLERRLAEPERRRPGEADGQAESAR